MGKLRDIASKRAKRKIEEPGGPPSLSPGDTFFYNAWTAPNEGKPSNDEAFAAGQLALADLYARQQAAREREREEND